MVLGSVHWHGILVKKYALKTCHVGMEQLSKRSKPRSAVGLKGKVTHKVQTKQGAIAL